MSKLENIRLQMNEWGTRSIPFFFMIDYNCEKAEIFELDKVPSDIHFNINGIHSKTSFDKSNQHIFLEKKPIPFEDYLVAIEKVKKEIKLGNSYLTNLSFQTEVTLSHSFEDLYPMLNAKYKLNFKNEFIVFSPESFIQIQNGKISTFPMKGTIDATSEKALSNLLEDKKEQAEHATIVDLLRNDLSMVSDNVHLVKYRYAEKIDTPLKSIYQTSSKITGTLAPDFKNEIGDILFKMLPAGSISGAPKRKTVEIINSVETHDRNYYTGVFGYFDGKDLDSGVMIRFIEKQGDKYFYKSGGGITFLSDPKTEYQELLDKIYVPVD